MFLSVKVYSRVLCSFLLSDRFVFSDSAALSGSIILSDSFVLSDSFIHSDGINHLDSTILSDRIRQNQIELFFSGSFFNRKYKR